MASIQIDYLLPSYSSHSSNTVNRITLTIHKDTYERLCDQGRVPESFDAIISRLLDYAENGKVSK